LVLLLRANVNIPPNGIDNVDVFVRDILNDARASCTKGKAQEARGVKSYFSAQRRRHHHEEGRGSLIPTHYRQDCF
jgi:hypothetical protein